MNFEMPKSRVYVKTDDKQRIIRCEGQYTLPHDLTDWILIEEGAPCDRLNLAQSHYFDGGLYTIDGIHRWKLEDGKPVLRSDDEIKTDRDARPAPPPTQAQRIASLETQLAESDEAAIALYESSIKQEAINAEQDEAIIEIYETIGGIING